MKKILILGGGFSAISVAQYLGKIAKRKKYIEVAIVCENNYFVFQPMLPEVASGGLEASHIINPIRRLCKNVTFHRAKVDNIDMKQKRVRIIGADFTRQQELEFDELVIGLGLSTDFSRVPGMAEHALPMKTLGDAFFLRNEMINKLEEASIEKDKLIQKKLLTFTVIGGGFSGVETIGEIADMVRSALKHYPQINKKDLRFILVHSGKRILLELSEKLGTFAAEKCRSRGIEVLLETRVKEVSPECIILSDDVEIPCRTVIATTGNAPHEVITELDFINDKGRLDTNASFQVIKKDKYGEIKEIIPNVWALGDCAFIPNLKEKPKDGEHPPCPPTAQFAIRQGPVCAKNIIANLNQKKLKQFKFKELGQMAIIGHLTGVAEVMGICFSGILAFALWRFVYWSKIPGLYCKFRVLIDWTIHFLFPVDITQLSVFRTEKVDKSHYQADSYIFHEGDIADYFYVIEKGEVEILKNEDDGTETLLATLKAGDSFGEMGLMQQAPRNASVKCKTPVGVLKINRHDFKALTGSYSNLRQQLEEKIDSINKVNQSKPTTLNSIEIEDNTEKSKNSFEKKSLVYQSTISQAQPSLAYKRQSKENRSTNSENRDIMKGQDQMNQENNNNKSMSEDSKNKNENEEELLENMDILPPNDSKNNIEEDFFFEDVDSKKEVDLDSTIDFNNTELPEDPQLSDDNQEGILDTSLDEEIEDLIIDIDGSDDTDDKEEPTDSLDKQSDSNSIFSTLSSTFNNWLSVKKPSSSEKKPLANNDSTETVDCIILKADLTPSENVCIVPKHDALWKAPSPLVPIMDRLGNDRFTDYIELNDASEDFIPVIGYQGTISALYQKDHLSSLPKYLKPIYSEEVKLPSEPISDSPKGHILALYNLFPYEQPNQPLKFNLEDFETLRPEIIDDKLSMDENGNVIWIECEIKRKEEIEELVSQVTDINETAIDSEISTDSKDDAEEATIQDSVLEEPSEVPLPSTKDEEEDTPPGPVFDEGPEEVTELDTTTEESLIDDEQDAIDEALDDLDTDNFKTDDSDLFDESDEVIEEHLNEEIVPEIATSIEESPDWIDKPDTVDELTEEDTIDLEDDALSDNLEVDIPDTVDDLSEEETEEDIIDLEDDALSDNLEVDIPDTDDDLSEEDTIVLEDDALSDNLEVDIPNTDDDLSEEDTIVLEDDTLSDSSEVDVPDTDDDLSEEETEELLDPQFVLEEAGIIPQQNSSEVNNLQSEWEDIPEQPYSVRESLSIESERNEHRTGIIEDPVPSQPSQEWKESEVLSETPKTASYYFEEGVAHRQNNELDLAQEAFEKTLSLQENHLDAKSRLAEIYRKKGEIQNAIQLLNHCLQSQEDHLFSLLNLGLCFLSKKEYKKAAKIYQFALDFHPNEFDVLFGLGESLRLLNQYNLAEKALREAIKLNETNLRPYLSLGFSLVKQEQVEKAKRLYGFAINRLESEEDRDIIQTQLQKLY